MANEISKLQAVLELDNSNFKKGLDQSEKEVESFGSSLKAISGVIAAAFATKEIIEFGIELSKIGVSVEVVSKAFADLANESYLEDLRVSTGRMVTDLELMQLTIQATNLGLRQADLPGYFRFATIRAAETGETVNKLVTDIVTGIGRKSTQILDNLGISVAAMNEQLAISGDFATAANILISEAMSKSKTKVEDTIIGVDQLSTSWTNFINTVSRGTGPINMFFKDLAKDLDEIREDWDWFFNPDKAKTSALDGLYQSLKDVEGSDLPDKISDMYSDVVKDIKFYTSELEKNKEISTAFGFNFGEKARALENITILERRLEILKEEKQLLTGRGGFGSYELRVALDLVGGGTDEIEDIPGLIFKINEEIKRLNLAKEAATSEAAISKLNIQLKDLNSELIRLNALPGISKTFGNLPISLDLINTGFQSMILNLSEIGLKASMAALSFQNLGNAAGDMSEDLASTEDNTQSLNSAIGALAAQGVASAAAAIGKMIGGGTEDALSSFIATIGNLMQSFGGLLIAFGISLEALKDSANPYVMIAAGAALVITGAALSEKYGNITQEVGGSAGLGSTGGATYGGGSQYDFNREVVLVARGEDLVAVLNRQNYRDGVNG